MREDPEYTAGRLLRANGRWSLTHRWLRGTDELRTKCGWIYEADEVYNGDEDVSTFSTGELPGGLANCTACFVDGS